MTSTFVTKKWFPGLLYLYDVDIMKKTKWDYIHIIIMTSQIKRKVSNLKRMNKSSGSISLYEIGEIERE